MKNSQFCISVADRVLFNANNLLSEAIRAKLDCIFKSIDTFGVNSISDAVNVSTASGSYSTVFVFDDLCLRYTPALTGALFCSRVIGTTSKADKMKFGCQIWAFGELMSKANLTPLGIAVVMERLYPLLITFSDEDRIFEKVVAVNKFYFHNDLKLNNIMMDKNMDIQLIDFDYMHASKITISVSCLETIDLDTRDFFQDNKDISLFRTFYDYTTLSLSVDGDNPLYMKILARLLDIFRRISDTVLMPMLQWLTADQLKDMPMEALVKCPGIEAVSVNILDLRGNAFAHNVKEWEKYPSLVKSNGVYWPDRTT